MDVLQYPYFFTLLSLPTANIKELVR